MFNKKHIISLIVIINLFLVGTIQVRALTEVAVLDDGYGNTYTAPRPRSFKVNYYKDSDKTNYKMVEIRFVYDRLGDNFIPQLWYYKEGSSELTKSLDAYPKPNSGNIADASVLPNKLVYETKKDEVSLTSPSYDIDNIDITKDKASVQKLTDFKTYTCSYVNSTTKKVLKIDYNQNGKSSVYLDGAKIDDKLMNYHFEDYSNGMNKTWNVIRKDNASDFSGGACSKFAYYTIAANGNTGVYFSDYSNPTATAPKEFKWIADSEYSKFNNSTGTQTSTNGPAITPTEGCGIFGNLLDDNGIIREIFDILKYLIVIGLVALGMVDYSKAVMAGDPDSMKKANKRFMNRIIIAILIFIMPILIDFVLTTFLGDVGDTCIKTL